MNWHRFLALFLSDFFRGSPFEVLNEIDLSSKLQLLDIVVLRRKSGNFTAPLPDGLGPLTDYNLISFKSFRETFDAWTVKELIGHYVNYRKQVSPSLQDLLPEERFRLIGLTARFPTQLGSQIELIPVQDGVYDCIWGTDRVRLIVIRELPATEPNSLLQLFSAVRSQVEFARDHYRQRDVDSSTLIQRLLAHYGKEGIPMPYTIEDFRREVRQEVLEAMSPDELLEAVEAKRIPAEAQLARMTPEQRLAGLTSEERLAGMPPEERLAGMPPEERLAGLTPEQLEAYLRKLRGETT